MSEEKITAHHISEEKNGQVSVFHLDGDLILTVDYAGRTSTTGNQQTRKFESAEKLETWVRTFNGSVLRKRKAYRPEFGVDLIMDECFSESNRG
jgi:hypothetical protein